MESRQQMRDPNKIYPPSKWKRFTLSLESLFSRYPKQIGVVLALLAMLIGSLINIAPLPFVFVILVSVVVLLLCLIALLLWII